MVGQRFGPHGVDFKARSLASAGSVNHRLFLEHDRSDSECYEDCDKDSSDIEVTLHASPCSFHEMVRYYTRFGCASDRLLPVVVLAMPRISTNFALAASLAAVMFS